MRALDDLSEFQITFSGKFLFNWWGKIQSKFITKLVTSVKHLQEKTFANNCKYLKIYNDWQEG